MNVVVLLIGKRVDSAVKVQEILTQNGDIIKTRLGINREPGSKDPGSGFIFLELCGSDDRMKKMCEDLNSIGTVKAECLKLDLPACSCE
ncbi:hypothetical protein [Candidatus Formimonas warabiya]|uniref:Uncharacterized protein n=1 Tax=Formimonas warabiya TaxID=1761012 RepID=A0A3G1KXD2_FORW1|nr:hypothetical protein [Candidatus Formimonas warabiya]ATW27057.1 hypothetical protein DCMF_21885 [Candidatus Formimonas warabiya]